MFETAYSLRSDGLAAYLSRDNGPASVADLFEATRASASDPFGPFMPLDALNSAAEEYDPAVSVDGQRLYFMRANTAGTTGSLWMAARPTPSEPFAGARELAELTAGPIESNPSLSADERTILFASNRGGDFDLYVATRPDRTAAFEAPRAVSTLNGPTDESEVFLRDDGCEVFFTSERAGTLGSSDLYRARVLAPD